MSARRGVASAAWPLVLALAVSSCEGVVPTTPDGPAGPGSSTSQAETGNDAGSDPGGSPGDAPDAPPTGEGEAGVEADILLATGISGVTEAETQLIETAEEWQAAWARITAPIAPAPEAPDVDFASRRVVLVAMGQRPSGGHGLELTGIGRAEDELRIEIAELSPGPGCITTQALTQPVLVLAIPAEPESVAVTREAAVRDCM